MECMDEPQGRKIFETVNEYLNMKDESVASLPNEVVIFSIMDAALHQLRDLIKKGKITWKEPYAQLEYDIPPFPELQRLFETEKPRFFTTWAMLVATRFVFMDAGIPGEVTIPSSMKDKIAGLTEEELAAGYELRIPAQGTIDTPDGKESFSIDLRFAIRPLTLRKIPPFKGLDYFFPVRVGLDIHEGNPAAWPKSNQDQLWKIFAEEITELTAPFLKKLQDKGEERPPILKPDNVIPIRPDAFAVAAGFVPMHKLAERNRAGLPLFQDASRTFHALRTPLNVATGLALFRFTSPDRPGDWQEVETADLTDQVFCLTDRGAPRRGDQAPDILGEVVKLFTETVAIVTPRFKKCGRFWKSRVDLIFYRIIAELGLTYIDTKTGRRVRPEDPGLPRDAVVPLTIKGRRAYTPDGKDIKALFGDRWKLESIRWRWSPSIVDDLLAAPALDKKGKVIRDKSGRVLRGGFNIKVIIRIFDALFRLRSEKAYTAHDLLVQLSTDIYKPPKQSTAGRNIIEREADRLFDLLHLEEDPKHPGRREEAVKTAIFRLKQPDIGALLAGSDELPRTDLNPNRRTNPYYRLVRSALYTPPGILTKEEVAALEAEMAASKSPALPAGPKTDDQAALPGIIEDAQDIPSGPEIRAAREAAGMNLRDFARMVGGGAIGTWSHYETGKTIRVGNIAPDVWERVRDFVATGGKKDGKEA